MQVSFTDNKLSLFFISEDKTKFEYRHDVNFLGICPETTCNDNGTGEAKRLIFEVVKHHNSRDIKLHLLKHALEINHQYVSEKDFKITGHGFRGTKQEKKSSWGIINSRNQINSDHSRSVGPIAVI